MRRKKEKDKREEEAQDEEHYVGWVCAYFCSLSIV